MCNQIYEETVLTLRAASASLPGRPHISTLHRWRMRGVRGIRLETCLIGGVRHTSREALQRFADATTRNYERSTGAQATPSAATSASNIRTVRRSSSRTEEILKRARI
jgi:hypothetical protein